MDSPAQKLVLAIGTTLLVLMMLWVALHVLMSPFGRDQGIFAWQGMAILQGGMPYADAWDHKGPLGPLLYAMAGATPLGVHLLDTALLVATLGSLALFWPRREAGILAALLFLWLAAPNWWNSGQPDLWAAEFILLALVLLQYRHSLAAAMCGVLLGSIILFKPVYVLPGAVAGFWFMHWRRKEIIPFVAGGSLPVIICLFWLWSGGALEAAFDAVVRFNLDVHLQQESQCGIVPPLRCIVYPAGSVFNPLVISALLVCLCAVWGAWRRKAWLLATVWAAAWLSLALQQRYFLYHYLPYFAVMALLAGEGVADVTERLRFPRLFLACFLLVLSPLAIVTVRTVKVYDAPPEGFSAAMLQAAAEQIRSRTNDTDRIYLWGYDAGLYVLSGRPAASKYGYNYPLLAGDASSRQAELMFDLRKNLPRLVVIQHGDRNSLYRKDSLEMLGEFRELEHFISDSYVEAWRNDGFIIYEHRSFPSALPR